MNILAVGFICMSIVWLALELMGVKFPMEPVLVVFGGLATLFASYCTWRPKYASRRLSGRITTDYSRVFLNDEITLSKVGLQYPRRAVGEIIRELWHLPSCR